MSESSSLGFPLASIIALGLTGGLLYKLYTHDMQANVPKDYAKKSSIEMRLDDVDENGTCETIVQYKGKKYLALDHDGDLRLVYYKVNPAIPAIPAKIVYQEEAK